jgi:pimeloyl-ACP methyl ester carboxylesterase
VPRNPIPAAENPVPPEAQSSAALPDGFQHRYVSTSRLRMHLVEAGSGEPILLLHGWPLHWQAWEKLIPLLSVRHRVICPDLRGFGWSDAPRGGYGTESLVDDVLALLDALELDRVLVIGHELGGRVAFHLCLRAPARVRRLITLNAMHPYWSVRRLAPQAWRYWWTVPVETPLVGRTVLRRIPAFMRWLFRLGQQPAHAVEPFLERLRNPARARAAERVMTEFAYKEIIPTLLGRYRQARLTVPTLMLNGTRDFALSPREVGGHEAYADDLRIELVSGAGHFLADQHPDLVADAALAHFGSSPNPRPGR